MYNVIVISLVKEAEVKRFKDVKLLKQKKQFLKIKNLKLKFNQRFQT